MDELIAAISREGVLHIGVRSVEDVQVAGEGVIADRWEPLDEILRDVLDFPSTSTGIRVEMNELARRVSAKDLLCAFVGTVGGNQVVGDAKALWVGMIHNPGETVGPPSQVGMFTGAPVVVKRLPARVKPVDVLHPRTGSRRRAANGGDCLGLRGLIVDGPRGDRTSLVSVRPIGCHQDAVQPILERITSVADFISPRERSTQHLPVEFRVSNRLD